MFKKSSIKLKDYPKEIQELIMKRAIEQFVYAPIDANCLLESVFTWEDSPEGFEFWYSIEIGDYNPFYELYPVPDTRVKK